MTLSDVESADEGLLAAAAALRGKHFPCTLTLAVDDMGVGTLRVSHAFFPGDPIAVSPLMSEDGITPDTLYGVLDVGDIRLTAVCVRQKDGLSGFFWLDNASTHIEFLYGG